MLYSRVKIVGVATVDVGRGGDVVNVEIKQQRRQDAPLRHPHLYLPPFTRLSLILNTNSPISEIDDEPAFEIRMKVRTTDFLDKAMVIDDIKCFAQINAEEASASRRLRLIESCRNFRDEREKSGRRRVPGFEAVLRGGRA